MSITRRRFLHTVVVTAGSVGVARLLPGCGGDARPTDEVFPQSIASGDPRTDRVVLWTRALPSEGDAAEVELELATDEGFSSRVSLDVSRFTVSGEDDHCLRLMVRGLSPDTTYYYRFVLEGTRSRVGRTRTAPTADADVPARFAFVSCQDYTGRFYNTYLRLLDGEHDDLVAVVHLGDYIYETTGDPRFMEVGSERSITFDDVEGALSFGEGESAFFAARSLDNYRQLYRAFRSDPVLQAVHERFPFICVWDDHEFADDSWEDVATHTDGVVDERDRERRRNSEQAYLEYMPIGLDVEADAEGALDVERDALFPNLAIYRDFRFGRHLHLAMTDYRSFRPDHPIPEEAYPGQVAMGEDAVRAALARLEADGDIPDADAAFTDGGYRPYVDLAEPALGDHRRALTAILTAGYVGRGVAAERAAELAADAAAGPVDAALLAAAIEDGRGLLPADLSDIVAPDPTDESLERGVCWAMMGKSSLTSSLGSRYLVVQRHCDLLAAYRTRVLEDEAHDHALGVAQEAWLERVVEEDDATWSVVAHSCSNTSLVLDLSPFADSLPESLPPERYYLTVDHWDGFPERRRRLMERVYGPKGALLIAGDVHSYYVTDHGDRGAGGHVLELTTASISSAPFRDSLLRTGMSVPAIAESGLLEPVLGGLDVFLMNAFDPLREARTNVHGLIVVEARADELRAAAHLLAEGTTAESAYDDPSQLSWTTDRWVAPKTGGRTGTWRREEG